ncbi:fungal-specific transcription factor domain-containing protein [Halteromyces radiatus]|uniref:fungal-specific transcription factor domain-containing protein n=1 Tax=Halteromyces radiatus TaxID=101107 RepID=UPI00221FBC5D|nr:fungal-specific transcription factor domain-containing protein [Halteromyces radiatus]KAI8090039.1 fungal-specific transcription factor domain-containing protein [Halteromyces radiatus]
MDTTESSTHLPESNVHHQFIGQNELHTTLHHDGTQQQQQQQQQQLQQQQEQQPFTRTEILVEQLTEGLTRLALHQQEEREDKTISSGFAPSSATVGSFFTSSFISTSMANSNNSDTASPWRSYGDFVRWTPEAYPPTKYSVPLEMPNQSIQEQLINVFFSQCSHLLPTISRRLFYDQLEINGPLITPLLLNVMYAHAAKYDHLWGQQGSKIFYSRARQLVDDFLDIPRMSTVMALLYLAAYDDGTKSSRCWMYTGMAVRMAMALGLYKANYYSNEMTQFDVELRKRVLWASYVMDQLQSTLMERPPMLTSNLISLDLPTPLPEDNDQERLAVSALSQLCRLVMILEKVVNYFASKTLSQQRHHHQQQQQQQQRQQKDRTWITGLSTTTLDDEQQIMTFLDEIKYWHNRLPHNLTWYDDNIYNDNTGNNGNDSNHFSLHQHQHRYRHSNGGQHWAIVNLHLLAFILELSILMCYQQPSIITERGKYLIRSISQLVSWTLHQPQLRISMTLTAFSGLLCASTLLNHCISSSLATTEKTNNHQENGNDSIGSTTNILFRQCLMDVRQCLQYIPTHDIHRFSHLVDTVLSSSSTNTATTTIPMDAAAAAAVVSATGVVGGDHDLDILSTVSPLHDSIYQQQQQRQQLQHTTKMGNYSSLVMPMYDKPNNSLLHGPVSQLLQPSSTVCAATHHPMKSTSSSSSSRSSFGLPSLTSTLSKNWNHTIEPADYTFELISVADEWARSLNYETQQRMD